MKSDSLQNIISSFWTSWIKGDRRAMWKAKKPWRGERRSDCWSTFSCNDDNFFLDSGPTPTCSEDDDDDNSSSTLSGQTPTPPSHLDELRQICQEYYNTMWKVESEKYDEEFELMKKEFEVKTVVLWQLHPPSSPSLESPSPLAIASDVPVSELSAPFWLPSKKSVLQMHYLSPSFLRRLQHFPKTLS